jgi:hypothetical protein
MDSEPKGHADAKLNSDLLDKITAVENFYNRREDEAKRLICAIPQKSVTRPWSSHYLRLKAPYDNFTVYCKKKMSRLLATCLSLQHLNPRCQLCHVSKLFFDRVEVEGVTSHLSFINCLVLDLSLFNRKIDSSGPTVSRKLCADLRSKWKKKCGPIVDLHYHSLLHFSLVSIIPTRLETTWHGSHDAVPNRRRAFAQVSYKLQQITTHLWKSISKVCVPTAQIQTIAEDETGDSETVTEEDDDMAD